MKSEANINKLRDIFHELKCETEQLNKKYFVINIPAKIDYVTVKAKLKELEEKEIIGYAESCLDDNHKV